VQDERVSRPIEDYGFIGNKLSCALVARWK